MTDYNQRGGSSEPNGPNSRARDASRDAGLDKSQQEELQRTLEQEHADLSYREILEKAKEIRQGRD